MNIDFASAMRRALEHTRAQKLNEATAVIQAALAEHCPSMASRGAAGMSAPPATGGASGLLGSDADTVEPAPQALRSQSARQDPGPLGPARRGPPSLIDPKANPAGERDEADPEAAGPARAANGARHSGRMRRSLGDVVNALRHGRLSGLRAHLPGLGAPAAPVSPPIPDGAQFLVSGDRQN
jgi:hypothetical protein